MIKIPIHIISRKEFIKYKKESILSSYLIHVENEIMNLQTQFKTDYILRKLILINGLSIDNLDSLFDSFIKRIKTIINILKE